MDDIELLRAIRKEPAPAEPLVLARARRNLLDDIDGRGPRRPAFRVRWRLALAGGLALALAGTAVVGQLQPSAPGNDPAIATGAGPSMVAPTDARSLLANAALVAEQREMLSARPDQFVYLESESVGRGVPASMRRIWRSVDGRHKGRLSERRHNTTGPWQSLTLRACPPAPASCPIAAYRTDLPTDPEAMLAYLRLPQGENTDTPDGVPLEWFAASDLLQDSYLPPASLSALYKALTTVPGIRLRQDAEDMAGRPGIAVEITRSSGHRLELILDRATYEYRGSRVSTADGTVEYEFAQLNVAIVDKPGQLP